MALSTLGYMGADSVPAIERLRPRPMRRMRRRRSSRWRFTVARCQSRETFIEGWRTSTQAERDAATMTEIMMGRRSLGALLESLTDRDPMLRRHAAVAADAIVAPRLLGRVLPSLVTGPDHDPVAVRNIVLTHRHVLETARNDSDEDVSRAAKDMLAVTEQAGTGR